MNTTHTQPPGYGTGLRNILGKLDYAVVHEGGTGLDSSVLAITSDSRAVVIGSLFVALPGTVTDGHHYIAKAIEQGTVCVVVQQGAAWQIPDDWAGCVVEVKDCRKAYAQLAENYYGCPAKAVKLIGITGTNGKTTITYLLEDVLEDMGYRVGVIGTVNYRYHGPQGKVVLPSPFTTPEAMQLQSLLFEMVQAGVEYVIMEVSSHALRQQRIGNLLYDIAVFTNLSHDHLDYHQTWEEYFRAKTLLFEKHLKADGRAVISTPQQPGDSGDWSGKIATCCRQLQRKIITCGKADKDEIRIVSYHSTLKETELQVDVMGQEISFTTPLVGHFNVDNVVTALGVVVALGKPAQDVIRFLSQSTGAPGRLQRVEVDDTTAFERPVVFVDFAHTPDALKQVLVTLAALPHRDLFCVFGCGGDRDTSKRPVMGALAGTYADVAIVTDDNPRTEVAENIRSQIVPGVETSGLIARDHHWLQHRNVGDKGFVEIGSRQQAIAAAIRSAGPADIVLIAGKGHEQYQLGLKGKRFFDDCMEAQAALLGWNCEAVALATGGVLRNSAEWRQKLLGNVSTDSRTIGEGDIFVALRGERFDGHDYLHIAQEKNAACLVVERLEGMELPPGIAYVEVADTLQALGDLARFRRRLMAGVKKQVVVAITGSCGKTTVKEMTASIFRRMWPAGPYFPEDAVLQTKGNLNNLIGLPLSLLPLTLRHQAAVLEMGMNAPGEIRSMARTAEPDICCITNVHGVHLAGLHDLDGVAAAKGELFAEAKDDAVLVVNMDDVHVRNLAQQYPQKKITYSATAPVDETPVDVFASDIEMLAGEVITFTLHQGKEQEQVHLYTVGVHNVANGVAAAALATAAGATLSEIAAGLADFRPSDRRMVQLRTESGIGILNDTYNANPASMEAGLTTLAQMGAATTAAILGDMLELGESSAAAHHQLGIAAAKHGIGFLAVVGEFRDQVIAGATAEGMRPDRVKGFADKADATEWIENIMEKGVLVEGDWILVKASRGLQMETIVARLTGNT